jgi:tRNA dimethylallyltransferase
LAVRELPIIVGPTAAGKSALAMALAEQHGAWIISADSRQVYRGFDIGTAKPTRAEQARVPHRGIDVADPDERYSAARWAADAAEWIAEADRAQAPVVLVGGTGLYVRALVDPIFAEPPLDPIRRATLAEALAALPTEELRRQVESVDPERAALGRTQLLRALEVYTLTGTPLSQWHVIAARDARVGARYLLVDPGESLRSRIAARVHAMLDAGWESEVAALMQTVPAEAPAWQGCGYTELRSVVADGGDRSRAIEQVIVRTRQYAKRQRTWFRHQLPASHVTPVNPDSANAVAAALAWWRAGRSLSPS